MESKYLRTEYNRPHLQACSSIVLLEVIVVQVYRVCVYERIYTV